MCVCVCVCIYERNSEVIGETDIKIIETNVISVDLVMSIPGTTILRDRSLSLTLPKSEGNISVEGDSMRSLERVAQAIK